MIARMSPGYHHRWALRLEPVWLRKWCKQVRRAPVNDNFEPLGAA